MTAHHALTQAERLVTWLLQDAVIQAKPGRLERALAGELSWLLLTDNEHHGDWYTQPITKQLRALTAAERSARARAWAAPFGEEAQRTGEKLIGLLASPPFIDPDCEISDVLPGDDAPSRYRRLSALQHHLARALIRRIIDAPLPDLEPPRPLWIEGYQPRHRLAGGDLRAPHLARALDTPGAPLHAVQISPFDERSVLESQIEALQRHPHPNLPRCLAWGELSLRRFWFATPRLRNVTLADLMEVRLEERSRRALLLQVLRGLDGLHAMGLTHGALSPERVWIGGDLRLKLMGRRWGAAPGDPREDIRAFGVLARRLLAHHELEGLEAITERCAEGAYPDAGALTRALAPLIHADRWAHRWAEAPPAPRAHPRGERGPQPCVSALMQAPHAPFALSPAREVLASSTPSGQLLLWDTTTRLPFTHLSIPPRLRGGCLAFTADGRRLAVAQEHHLQLWDARRGALLWEERLAHPICALAISPDDQRLALGSGESLWLRSLEPDGLLQRVFLDADTVRAVAFSPDGARIAVGEDEGVVILEGHTPARSRRLEAPPCPTRALIFSPDGGRVAALVGYGEGAQTWVWSLPEGGLLERTPVSVESAGAIIEWRWPRGYDAPEAPDEIKLRSSQARFGERPWWGRGAPSRSHHNIRRVFITPDEGALVSMDQADGTLRHWGRGPHTRTFQIHHDASCIAALSPDGRCLAFVPSETPEEIWLVDHSTGEIQARLARHGAMVRALAFSPDGALLASGGRDHTIRIWSVARGALEATHTKGHRDAWSRWPSRLGVSGSSRGGAMTSCAPGIPRRTPTAHAFTGGTAEA